MVINGGVIALEMSIFCKCSQVSNKGHGLLFIVLNFVQSFKFILGFSSNCMVSFERINEWMNK